MPLLASTPEQENAPMQSQQDSLFLVVLSQLSEEEINKIIGNIVNSGTQPDIYQEAGTLEFGISLTFNQTANLLYLLPVMHMQKQLI